MKFVSDAKSRQQSYRSAAASAIILETVAISQPCGLSINPWALRKFVRCFLMSSCSRKAMGQSRILSAERIDLNRPATALTGSGPVAEVCRQVATSADGSELLTVRVQGLVMRLFAGGTTCRVMERCSSNLKSRGGFGY